MTKLKTLSNGKPSLLRPLVACAFAGALAGCAESDSHDQGNISQRQDTAVKDPFSYGPSEGKSTTPAEPQLKKRDDTLKGEWDRTWNP